MTEIKKTEFLHTSYLTIFVAMLIFVFRIREYGSNDFDFQIILRLFAISIAIIYSTLFFKKSGFRIANKSEFLLILFILISFIFLPFSIDYTRSVIVIFSFVSVYLLFKVFSQTLNQLLFLKVIMNFCLFTSIMSFLFYFLFPELGRHIYWYENEIYTSPRLSGVFATSNAAGGFAGFFLLSSFYCLTFNIFRKNFCYICILAAFIILILSDSRTSLAITFICIYFLLSSGFLKVIYLTVSVFSIFLILILFLIDSNIILASISRHGDITEIFTFTGRTYIWPAVFEMANDRFFYGYGLGVTSVAIPLLSDIIGYSPAHAHNLLLQAYFSLGFLGFVVILFLLIYSFMSKNKLAKAFAVYLFFTGLMEASFLAGMANEMFVFLIIMILLNDKELLC